MRRRHLFRPLLALLPLALPTSGLAKEGELFVVVNSANALRSISKKELIALYTGRSRHFPDDSLAEPFDHPRESAVREAFYAALTGMDLAQINSYWARLLFTGRVQPPQALADDAALQAEIKRNRRAIAYLSHEPTDSDLRVVMVLRRAG